MGLTLRVYAHETPAPPRSGRPEARPPGFPGVGSLAVLAPVPGGPLTGEIGLKFFGQNPGANRRFRGWIGWITPDHLFSDTRSGHFSYKNKGFPGLLDHRITYFSLELSN